MIAWYVVLSTNMLMLVLVAFFCGVVHDVCVPPEDRAMLGSNLSAAWSQRCRGGGESRHLSSLCLPAMLQEGDKSILRMLAAQKPDNISLRSELSLVCRGLCSPLFFGTCFGRRLVQRLGSDLPWFLSPPLLLFASGSLGSCVAVCSG